MSENQVPAATAVPEMPTSTSEPGSSPHLPALIRYGIVSLHLEDKGVLFVGDDEPYDVWEHSNMMVGWLWIAVDGVEHKVFFASTPTHDMEGIPCLCETLEVDLGSELNTWIGEQVGRIWSDPNLMMQCHEGAI